MCIRRLMISALAAFVAGCTAEDAQPPPVESPADAPEPAHPLELTEAQRSGRELFETVCWTCHGSSGRGDGPVVGAGSVPPPPSFHTSELAALAPQQIIARFSAELARQESTHPHMRYVTSIIEPEKFKDALAYVPALAFPPGIPGSALEGRRIYEVRCVGCHGPMGRGDGPWAASLRVRPPADFTTDTLLLARDYEAVHERIREGGKVMHGSSMPPWGLVLTDGEIWDLVAYLSMFADTGDG